MNYKDLAKLKEVLTPTILEMIETKKGQITTDINKDTKSAYSKMREIMELEYLMNNFNYVLSNCEKYESSFSSFASGFGRFSEEFDFSDKSSSQTINTGYFGCEKDN